MALVSNTTAKLYIPELSGSTMDTLITDIIARVEATFARLLGFPENTSGEHTLNAADYILYEDGPMYSNSEVIQLSVKPIVTVTSVHSDVDRAYGSATLIASSEYELDKENAKIIQKPNTATTSFDQGYRALKIVCNCGYNTSTPPADLVHAICIMTAKIYRLRGNIGQDSITQRQSTIKVQALNIPPEVKQILYPYRNTSMIL